MFIFEKRFFKLVVDFADKVHLKHKIPYTKVLYTYTPIYVRLLGFSDLHLPQVNNPKWIEIISTLPKSRAYQSRFLYRKHVDHERKNNSPASQTKKFGCFSYTYHVKDNKYELHFHAADPQGNLSKNRFIQRMQELKRMFTQIKLENKPQALLYVRTWLLNINSFTRLFPEELTKNTVKYEKLQDNTFWGQFVDRHGLLKSQLAQQLLKNVEIKSTNDIRDYFPLPGLVAEIPNVSCFKFYKID